MTKTPAFYATVLNLKTVQALFPRNSKGFKRDLREMAPEELRALQRDISELETLIFRFTKPIEEELHHKTGRYF
jgi:hypothetical protein